MDPKVCNLLFINIIFLRIQFYPNLRLITKSKDKIVITIYNFTYEGNYIQVQELSYQHILVVYQNKLSNWVVGRPQPP
jgi:hypothetical protein